MSAVAPDWIPLLVPDMPSPEELLPYLQRMHAARHYSNFGPLVQELEAAFARRFALPQPQVTTLANATLGLELVLQALDLPRGSRVLIPAFTFVATATAVVRAGHIPVLTDVDDSSWLLTPAIARAACAQTRVDAVLPVAAFGMPHDMQAWQQFEHDSGLPVVIDAAAAWGSQWLQGAQGTLVFSLHTTKSLPAGEGGLLVSTRPGLAERVRQLSNFGINLDPAASVPLGSLAATGSNAKMSEYHAAIGLISLSKWELEAKNRQALEVDLTEKLNIASHGRLRWQTPAGSAPLLAPTTLCPRLPDAAARSALEAACAQARIMTRRWYQPLLSQMQALPGETVRLPTPCAQDLAQTLLGLPFFPGMMQEQSERVRVVVERVFNRPAPGAGQNGC